MISFTIEREMNWQEFFEKNKISHRFRQKLFKERSLFLNGELSKKNQLLKKDDVVMIKFPREEADENPEELSLDILYEDDFLLAINKPPFILSHPTPNNPCGTLLNAAAFHFLKIGLKRKVRLINRLDRDTSGVILIAKNPLAHSIISESIIEKEYLALAEGVIEKAEDIFTPIKKEGIRRVADENGKNAHTAFEILKRYKDMTLLKVKIFTGKTHQIRVHLESIGHPIIGDSLYGSPCDFIKRQALHSYKISFYSLNGEKKTITAPLPSDFKEAVKSER